jgi:hypothetical protein
MRCRTHAPYAARAEPGFSLSLLGVLDPSDGVLRGSTGRVEVAKCQHPPRKRQLRFLKAGARGRSPPKLRPGAPL